MDAYDGASSHVAEAFGAWFRGYHADADEILKKTFEEIDGYDDMIVLRGIRFESYCEHHMTPIVGRAWIAYPPTDRVVGISKLARLVDAEAKRLQIQEQMTSQIAKTIDRALRPRGVAAVLKAQHHGMTTRGVLKPATEMVATRMLAAFRDTPGLRQKLMAMVD